MITFETSYNKLLDLLIRLFSDLDNGIIMFTLFAVAPFTLGKEIIKIYNSRFISRSKIVVYKRYKIYKYPKSSET